MLERLVLFKECIYAYTQQTKVHQTFRTAPKKPNGRISTVGPINSDRVPVCARVYRSARAKKAKKLWPH